MKNGVSILKFDLGRVKKPVGDSEPMEDESSPMEPADPTSVEKRLAGKKLLKAIDAKNPLAVAEAIKAIMDACDASEDDVDDDEDDGYEPEDDEDEEY